MECSFVVVSDVYFNPVKHFISSGFCGLFVPSVYHMKLFHILSYLKKCCHLRAGEINVPGLLKKIWVVFFLLFLLVNNQEAQG
jgi:hypothetical protein